MEVVSRLSPNEEESLLRQQRDQRRKARLLQVREQEKTFAQKMRAGVRNQQENERKLLENCLQEQLQACHTSELGKLEDRYLARANCVGQAHKDAQLVAEERDKMEELRIVLASKQRIEAEDRYAIAIKEEISKCREEEESKENTRAAVTQALNDQKRRYKEMSGKLTEPTLIMDLAVGRGQHVVLKGVEGYASTYYHIPYNAVCKDTPSTDEPCAHEIASLVAEGDATKQRYSVMIQQEQAEKARLRHKHAMSKVKLEIERKEMLRDLKVLEREDRTRRQRVLANIPENVFQPAHQRVTKLSKDQRDMEIAFEKLFVTPNGTSTATSSEPTYDDTSGEQNLDADFTAMTSLRTDLSKESIDPSIMSSPSQPPDLSKENLEPSTLSLKSPDLQPPDHELSVEDTTTMLSSRCSQPPELSILPVSPSDVSCSTISVPTSDDPPAATHTPQVACGEHRMQELLALIKAQQQAWNERLHLHRSCSASDQDLSESSSDSHKQVQQQHTQPVRTAPQCVTPSPQRDEVDCMSPVPEACPACSPQSSESVRSKGENAPGVQVPRSSMGQESYSTGQSARNVSMELSLQEVFLLKKQTFIQQSQQRLDSLKANAALREKKTSLATKKSDFPFKREPAKKTVCFSSPVYLSYKGSNPASLKKSNISHKEMRERNKRFFSCLPEVKQKEEERQRKVAYALNLEKAKLYKEKVRAKARMRRKQ